MFRILKFLDIYDNDKWTIDKKYKSMDLILKFSKNKSIKNPI
jgi:hypothetical protein